MMLGSLFVSANLTIQTSSKPTKRSSFRRCDAFHVLALSGAIDDVKRSFDTTILKLDGGVHYVSQE